MKRILAVFLAISMLLSLSFSVATAEGTDGMLCNFDYDFSLGNLFWSTNGTTIRDEAMEMKNDWCEFLVPSGIKWKNYTLEFDYIFKDFSSRTKEDTWIMIPLKGSSLLIRNGAVSFYKGGSESSADGVFQLRKNGTYHFKIEAHGKKLVVTVSGTGLPREVVLLNRNDNDSATGTIKFTGWFQAMVDNIKVYVDPNEEYVAKEKIKIVSLADTTKFEFTKTGDKKLVWASSKPEIATIEEDGTITGLKKGFSLITASDENGNVIENMGVYVINPVETIDFVDKNRDGGIVYVGDTVGITLNFKPDAANIATVWEMNDPSLGELYGSSARRRAFTATAPGDVEIKVKDRFTGAEGVLKLKVEAERPKDKSANTTFYATGVTRAANKEVVGFHYDPKANFETNGRLDMVKEIKPRSLRTLQELMFSDAATEDQIAYLDKIEPWKDAELMGASQLIYCASHLDTPEQILEQVKHIYGKLNKDIELVVELANETYAIQFESTFPTAEEYFQWAAKGADLIHEWNPDIKCIALTISGAEESNILSDETNLNAMLKDDWAYTQGDRIVEWIPTLIKYKDHFDGVTSHNYLSTGLWSMISDEDFVRMGYAWNEATLKHDLNVLRRTDYTLPFYYIEWGNLAADMFWGAGGMNNEERTRYQWMEYPYAAMRNMEQMMDMLSNGYTEGANNHFMFDLQGFGTFANDTPLLNSLVMKETSELLETNDTYYDIFAPENGYYSIRRPYYHEYDKNITVDNVKAWGLGTKEKLNNLVISNHTNVPQTFSLKGTKLSTTWSYGGSVDKIMPDWLRNKNYTNWLHNDGVDLSFVPKEYKNNEFKDEIVIEPYSIMVLDVEGTPELLQNSCIGKISHYAQLVLDHALVLKVGEEKAYKNTIEVQVDPDNSNIVPKIKEGRTLLPLRFVAESFGCEVAYDDATKGIKISGDGIDIDMQVGKANYKVNGKALTFDVPAEVEEGRTYVPLRALAEALNREVHWDERGLITIYSPKTGWTSKQTWFDETLKAEIDTVVALYE